ncbi:tetratricopeptide repeat protein [Mangrovimicrobium sediminis]|uniref:tetratricopeptide repeat protein n=1 Tax=Mangrovimicrobium sediminis TaxID=2562682 RepID=UPI001436AAE2|nr:tetratricopeptide repeat protein [Haliea sp. SAOS-164]
MTLLLLLACPLAGAAESVVGMSQRVYDAMNEAQTFVEAGDFAAARGEVEPLLNNRISPYEKAHILNLLGYIHYEQDELGKARGIYEQAIELENLPESMQINLLLALGQLCLVQEDYREAENRLRQLMTIEGQDTGANKALLAIALVRQERFEEALQPLKEAIASRSGPDDQPPENWLSMLASIYFEMKAYTDMRDTMEYLVTLYPREQYLMNLAALHGELGDTPRQLALVESLLDEGRLTQATHLRMLASLFLAEELPYKAAVLLQREIDGGVIEATQSNLEMLSQAWLAAADTEKAIPPLERAAALDDSGDLYLRVAQLQMDAWNWEQAEAMARKAIAKGGLRREGVAWLVRGMAQVRLHKLTDARSHFERAARFDETERYADQWLAFVDHEMEQKALLEEGS